MGSWLRGILFLCAAILATSLPAAHTGYAQPPASNLPPRSRFGHTAVWTGSSMIVWGGDGSISGLNAPLGDGARYDPNTDTWAAVSTVGSPSARSWHSAVWTDSEMIVWGGWNGSSYLNGGARYNPSTDTWTPLPVNSGPGPQAFHSAVWTGTEMIVVGTGRGARYSPSTNSWTLLPTAGAPQDRAHFSAIWTGSKLIAWGVPAAPREN